MTNHPPSDQQLIQDFLKAQHLADFGNSVSSPAHKPASVPGGSDAGLVGTPSEQRT